GHRAPSARTSARRRGVAHDGRGTHVPRSFPQPRGGPALLGATGDGRERALAARARRRGESPRARPRAVAPSHRAAPRVTMPEPPLDLSAQYEEMLARGIRLSGEDQRFFIDGRVRALRARLPADWRPARVLDFGCGVGHAVPALRAAFPGATLVGVDTAEPAL